MRSIPITENAFPLEEGDKIMVFPCGKGWGACYAEEEADEFDGQAFVFHPYDALLAAADLVLQYPREVRP